MLNEKSIWILVQLYSEVRIIVRKATMEESAAKGEKEVRAEKEEGERTEKREWERVSALYGFGWQIQSLRSGVACMFHCSMFTSFSLWCKCLLLLFFLYLFSHSLSFSFLLLVQTESMIQNRLWLEMVQCTKYSRPQRLITSKREGERERAFCHPSLSQFLSQVPFWTLTWTDGLLSLSLSLLSIFHCWAFQSCFNTKPKHL